MKPMQIMIDAMYGHISALADGKVPEVYRRETSCTLAAPRDGVDLLIATPTHLIDSTEAIAKT